MFIGDGTPISLLSTPEWTPSFHVTVPELWRRGVKITTIDYKMMTSRLKLTSRMACDNGRDGDTFGGPDRHLKRDGPILVI